MGIKKILLVGALSLVIIFICLQAFGFWKEERDLGAQLADIQARFTKAQADNANLKQDLEYLSNPVNLEKELRSRFNYKIPGETMVVIVPNQSSTGP
jgi:peptidoglycan hydrolase CwlO-like protein